jgi:hypothetical protein
MATEASKRFFVPPYVAVLQQQDGVRRKKQKQEALSIKSKNLKPVKK